MAEEFKIKLTMDSAGVVRGAKDAAHAIEELGGRFSKYFGPGSIVAGAVGGMVEFVREQVKWAGELKDVAEKLDTTTRKVQGLKYAAAATRTPFEEFEGGINKMRKAQSEALQGNEEQIKNFERLGISVEELKSLDAPTLFIQWMKAIEEGKGAGAGYAAALAIGGKEAAKLFAAAKDGAAGMAETFDRSSFVVQRNLVQALDDADKSGSKLWATLKSVGRYVGANLAGGLVSAGKLAIGTYAATVPGGQPVRDRMAVSRELQNDKDYGDALDIQSKLEAQLNAKLALKAEEHLQYEILKKKNDEREKELKLAGLSTQERKTALEAEKAELQTKIEGAKTDLEKEKLRTRLVEVNGDLGKIAKEGLMSNGNTLAKPESDKLLEIGGYRGGGSIDRIPTQQLEESRRHTQILTRIAHYAETGKKSEDIMTRGEFGGIMTRIFGTEF